MAAQSKLWVGSLICAIEGEGILLVYVQLGYKTTYVIYSVMLMYWTYFCILEDLHHS